jgi:hypothetical protein
MARQEAARSRAIRALVNLSQFPDDSDAALQALRLLEAAPSELTAAARRELGAYEPRDPQEG